MRKINLNWFSSAWLQNRSSGINIWNCSFVCQPYNRNTQHFGNNLDSFKIQKISITIWVSERTNECAACACGFWFFVSSFYRALDLYPQVLIQAFLFCSKKKCKKAFHVCTIFDGQQRKNRTIIYDTIILFFSETFYSLSHVKIVRQIEPSRFFLDA